MKRFIRRPSPSMAVACIALFVALGGVSYGVATGSIDGREIKNRSITNKDFKDGTLRGNEAKPDGFGAGAIKEATLGPVPSAHGLAQSAVVSPAGAVVRGFGGPTATRTGTGRYAVIFNRNVQSCVYVATIGDEAAGGPGSGTVSVATLQTNPNAVDVRTANAANNAPENHSFHLIVTC